MRILHLTLKKKWFDMILSGEKKEEYREWKPYWVSRLVDGLDTPRNYELTHGFVFEVAGHTCSMRSPQGYDAVQFRNGYSTEAPTMLLEIKDIVADFGKEDWGAEYNKPYFVIKLGAIISQTNIKP